MSKARATPDDDARAANRAATDIWWPAVQRQAEEMVRSEPTMAPLAFTAILGQPNLEAALIQRLSMRLAGALPGEMLRRLFHEVVEADETLRRTWRLDLAAVLDRDPAATGAIEPILYFKGFHALQAHRIAHALWRSDRIDLAFYIADRVSEVLQVDIHPAARLGSGVFIDHATSIVIGETATIGDNVSILQGVLLGSDGSFDGTRRHPRIGNGVMIGSGAKLLGPIEIGHCSRIGAGSVVTQSFPPNVTVAGNPARVLGHAGCAEPYRAMDQLVFDVGL